MLVKIISDDKELKDFCYEPLKSGHIYKASFENNYYTRVFFFVNDEEYNIVIHDRHIKKLNVDEIRDYKLNKIGI